MRKPAAPLKRPAKRKRGLWRRILFWVAALVVGFYALCGAVLLALKWIDPPVTMVQIQRRVEAAIHRRPYRKRYVFVPLGRISKDLQHAVIASEDERFYQHHGIDWTELHKVVDRDLDRGKLGRGASTITQQLVKNLFLTTSRSVVRKAIEFTITPAADLILGKRRVLELYLNTIEWGPGIYGAEAAASYYYSIPAARLGREESARLAAIIPSPLTRKPARMEQLSADILEKMRNLGW
ncbi:MAG TPA: monofunctional biosynthetic peptidoglycan transglycosylase [Bryobacteraceae bacterium]|nr:monofunctional biosynthetic peptidoglycan transglycosylase [Bryobacteraceae bacterium]